MFKLLQRFPFLAKLFHFHDGFIAEPVKEEDYTFGAVDKEVLQPDGQWIDYLPEYELQHGKLVDTMACVTFSCLNVLEMLAKRLELGVWNKSDRFTAKMSGTSRNGNVMSNVIDSVRKHHGVVKEETWPWDKDIFNWNEFYKYPDKGVINVGKGWLNEYEVKYEAIYNNNHSLMNALRYGPLWVAGFAWYKKGDCYVSYGRANHAFTIVGYKENEYWLAFDSYSPHIKHLAWDFNIAYPKLITLRKKEELEDMVFNIALVLELIKKGYKYILRPESHGQIYELTEKGLKYLSPEEARDLGIKTLAGDKKLIGINEEFFSKLTTK